MTKENINDLFSKIFYGTPRISTKDLNVYTTLRVNGNRISEIVNGEDFIPKDCIIEWNIIIMDSNKYEYVCGINIYLNICSRRIINSLYIVSDYKYGTIYTTDSNKKFARLKRRILSKYD